MLGRRVPLLLRARDQGLAATAKVAERLAQHLGWDAARIASESDHYRSIVATTRRFHTDPV